MIPVDSAEHSSPGAQDRIVAFDAFLESVRKELDDVYATGRRQFEHQLRKAYLEGFSAGIRASNVATAEHAALDSVQHRSLLPQHAEVAAMEMFGKIGKKFSELKSTAIDMSRS